MQHNLDRCSRAAQHQGDIAYRHVLDVVEPQGRVLLLGEAFFGQSPQAAAVLGGVGSLPGAMLGGYIIGILEIMIVAFYPDLAGYRDAYAFVILLIILLVKPTGLIGEKLEEKV